MAESQLSGKLAVILHADIAGSTALVQQDEQLAHERIQETFRRFGDTITRYHGRIRELRGDALLADFERASDAVTAALSFQASHTEYTAQLNDNILPTLRVGIAMGEVIIADDTITGAGVVLAQRLEQLAEPGGVVIQGAAYETIPGRFPFEYENLGEHEVKGFEEPVRVYSARLKPDTDIPKPGPPIHRARNTIIAFASITVLIAGLALMWFKPWEIREQPALLERMAFPLPEKPSIALLAFENFSQDPEQRYVSDALSENIITELSRFPELFVISRNSSFVYKDKPVKVQQVAEELGVRYVIEGSFQKDGDRVRVNVQLIDAIEGNHVWAERYDQQAKDIFDIQDEITRSVVATVWKKVELIEGERVMRKPPANLEAYEYRLRGLEFFYEWSREGNEKARQMFEKAVESDPEWARGYSTLAWAHINDYLYFGTREESLQRAHELAQIALEKDPFHYHAHSTMAYVLMQRGDLEQALAEYERSLELNPNSSHELAASSEALILSGRAEDAVVRMKQAIRLNPHHPDWFYWTLAWAYYFAEQYEEALVAINSMPDMPNIARRIQAAILVELGRLDEARAVIAEFQRINPGYTLEDFKLVIGRKYKSVEYRDRWIEDLRKAGLPEKRPTPSPDKPSIAVLPFTNMSNEAEQEYFADGMTEDLITDISKISGLKVIARHSTFSYKGQNPDVRNVGTDLGATHVIEGSVRKAGNIVRITIQLIDASDGKHVWAERYDRELRDVFAIQDEVIGKIITALSLKLTPEEVKQVVKRGTENLTAYDLYMRGRQQESFFSKDTNVEAQQYYEQAVALDPNYAEAYAHLAQIHTLNGQFGWVDDIIAADKRALELVEKSIALDPDIPFSRFSYSRILSRNSIGQHDRAVEEANKAIELDPNYADAHAYLSQLFILTGQAEKAIEPIKEAMRINPNYPFWYDFTFGHAYFFMRDFDTAVANIEKAAERNPNVIFVRTAFAASLAMAGRQDDAEWQIDELYGLGFNKTLDEYIRESPIQDPAYRALIREGLAKAGLP